LWLQKRFENKFSHPSLLLLFLDLGSEIRDPRSGIRDPGFEIRDPRSGMRDLGWVKIRNRDKHLGSATLISIFELARVTTDP
jgi:predicted transcriptional regulator